MSGMPEQALSTLLGRIEQHATTRAEAPALLFLSRGGTAQPLTWARLHARVRAMGATLVRAGVSPGDVVFVLSASPQEQVLGFLGAMAAGALPTILSFPSLKQSEERFHETLRPIAHSTGARWVISSGEFEGIVTRAGLEARVCVIPPEERLDAPADGTPLPRPSPAFLQFSSGTTGLRKCVRITDEMLLAQAAAYASALDLRPEDRIASWLPLYHDMGLVACLLIPLLQGNFSLHMSPFEWLAEPALLLKAVSRWRASFVWLPNFSYRLCAEQIRDEDLGPDVDLSCLRAIINCSEPVRHRSHEVFARRFASRGVREAQLQACYAMAEATFAVTQTVLGQAVRVDRVRSRDFSAEHRAVPAPAEAPEAEVLTFVSCGRPVEGVSVRIAGGEAERHVGEILVRGTFVIPGYGVEGRGSLDAFTEDGWYRTGDLGYFADGELYVTGRAKDLIIHRGHNIYPTDIEEALAEVRGYKPGRLVAFGVYDEAQGTEEVVLMLETDGTVEPAELRRQVREQVWTRLNVAVADVDVCEPGSLLKSTSGKLSRTSNRKLWQERREARRQAAAERPRARPAMAPRDLQERQLVWIWEEVLGTSPIGVEDNLFLELGADSVLAMRAAAEVQRRLSVSVQPSVLLGAQTVERQAAVLREAAGGEVAPLVTLQHRGAGRPFFLVHAAGGWAFPYVSLVRHLGQERPVHAFQAPQLALGGAEEMTIPGMAEKYLAAMRKVQPKGPYLLGGWSLGGFVAFEMANQLKAQGEEVAGLVMFDTHPPLTRKDYLIGRTLGMVVRAAMQLALRSPGLGRRLPFVSGVLQQSPVWRFFLAYLITKPKDIRPLVPFAFPETCDRQRLAGMDPDAAWSYVVELAHANDAPADRVLLLPGLDGPGARRTLSVSRRLEVLNGTYAPRWRYAGDLDIIGVRGNASLEGWKPYVQGQLNLHWYEVEKRHVNAHFDMMEDTNVQRFTEDLRALLRRADP